LLATPGSFGPGDERRETTSGRFGRAKALNLHHLPTDGQLACGRLLKPHFVQSHQLQRVLEDVYGIEFFAASEHSGEGVRFRKSW
jgi:hypothetical protein